MALDHICTANGGPSMNMDIAGIGVRISFYLQTLFLACWSLRSSIRRETASALYTLIITNMAMTSSILILGLKPNPEVNFHDALIALYLLFVSIITVYCALPSGRPFDILHYLSIAQNCGFFAFLLVLIIKAQTFGSTPKCNRNAVLVLLRPFPALPTGQIVGSIITVAMIVFYGWMLVREHLPTPPKKGPERLPSSKLGPVLMAKFNLPKQTTEEEEVSKETVTNVDHAWSSPDTLNVDWRMLLRMGAVTALWTIGIVNTELLIKWSHFARDSDSRSNWQFGQVLPLFLVVIPFVGLVESFQRHGLRRTE